jgi:hypothetical protein
MLAASFYVACGNTMLSYEASEHHERQVCVIEARGEELAQDVEAWKCNAPVPIRDFVRAADLVRNVMRRFLKKNN